MNASLTQCVRCRACGIISIWGEGRGVVVCHFHLCAVVRSMNISNFTPISLINSAIFLPFLVCMLYWPRLFGTYYSETLFTLLYLGATVSFCGLSLLLALFIHIRMLWDFSARTHTHIVPFTIFVLAKRKFILRN